MNDPVFTERLVEKCAGTLEELTIPAAFSIGTHRLAQLVELFKLIARNSNPRVDDHHHCQFTAIEIFDVLSLL